MPGHRPAASGSGSWPPSGVPLAASRRRCSASGRIEPDSGPGPLRANHWLAAPMPQVAKAIGRRATVVEQSALFRSGGTNRLSQTPRYTYGADALRGWKQASSIQGKHQRHPPDGQRTNRYGLKLSQKIVHLSSMASSASGQPETASGEKKRWRSPADVERYQSALAPLVASPC
jgi:hypothetical protein